MTSDRPDVRRRVALVAVLAAVAAAIVAATVVGTGDDDDQIVADEGAPDSSIDTTSSSVPPETTTSEPEDDGVGFELLGAFPATEMIAGSMVYAGVPDALTDHWMITGTDEPVPVVDFDHRAVFVLTVPQAASCPHDLAALERDDSIVRPVFVAPADTDCEAVLGPHSYFLAVERAALPPRFTLVLAAAPDASYPEQRLDVDLSTNFSASSPPPPPQVAPDGPDLQAPEPGREITVDGVGDVRLGQPLDPSAVTPYDGHWSCGYWGPNEPTHDGDQPPSGLYAADRPDAPRVLSIMVRHNPNYRTASGVGVGTTLETLERIYGDDLVVDRADGWDRPTDGLLASYQDVAAVRFGDNALTYHLMADVVTAVKVSRADFWGDDEGCA